MRPVKTLVMSGSRTGCRYAGLIKDLDTAVLTLAVTGLDKPCGRGRKIRKAHLADFCERSDIDAVQTCNINSDESVRLIKEAGADLAFVVDFGQILSPEVLSLFPMGCYNIHYSLLPKLRGAAPVRWALIRGYEKTGVTLMRMSEKVDAGGMIFSEEVPVYSTDDHDILKSRLTDSGLELTRKFFRMISSGDIPEARPQPDSEATSAPKISGSPFIDWSRPSVDIFNLIRGMAPSPGTFTRLEKKNQKLKVLQAFPSDIESLSPGLVSLADKKSLYVSTGTESLRITMVQPAGKRPMSISSFLSGNPLKRGDKFV